MSRTSDVAVVDAAIVRATQGGLPLVRRPYDVIAATLGIAREIVIERLAAMIDSGAIRRIGVVPNHYRLGWVANGMSVWDVDDARVDELGARIGMLPGVSHCYRRPRRPPVWRYNLFAMVHGRDIGEVERQVAGIASILGDASRAHDVLYSTKVLKKTGLRFAPVSHGELSKTE